MNVRIFGAMVTVTVASACAGYYLYRIQQPPPDPVYSIAGQRPVTAPEFEAVLSNWSFADLDGGQQNLGKWAGKVVVVNFWATWCPPCMREIPAFVKLQERYGDEGLQFVGIAMDRVENVAVFAENHGINYPMLVGQEDVAVFMRSLGNEIGALPYTAIVDRQGSWRFSHQGEWSEREVEHTIRALL